MKKEVLRRPFLPEQVKQRPGQHGKVLRYVETHAVIARLNEGCDAWSFEIERHQIVEDEVIVVGKLVADGVVKTAFGGATITRDREGRILDLGNTHKAAASDALKKAASLLGVGLDLVSDIASKPAGRPLNPLAAEDRLTERQLAAIHAASRRRGIGAQRLASMVLARWGKQEVQCLTRGEASALISELSGMNDKAS